MMPVNPKTHAAPWQRLVDIASTLLAFCNQALNQVLQWLVRLYQLTLSPFIGNQCRFHPSCSHYAMESLQRHGPWRGSWLAAKRLGRCQPLAEGGFDPVPATTPDIHSIAPSALAPTLTSSKETL